MTDNLALWHLVEKTDPAHVKAITGKSYKGTSPKPHWIVMKATETFGPIGIGWGFTVDERIERGALIADGFYEQMHIAKVKVWFKWNGERGEVEHIGGTTFSGRYSSGKTFTDEDAPKKSVTDALIKALSMIGFAGDIFMGRFDDSKYVQEIAREFGEEKQQADKPKPVSAAEQKRGLESITQELLDCRTPNDAQKIWKAWTEVFKEQDWSRDYIDIAKERIQARGRELKDTLENDDFPGDRQNGHASAGVN